MQIETKEHIIFALLGLILLVLLLSQYSSKHVITEVKARKITNIDVYRCTKEGLDKHHAELLDIKTVSVPQKKYLRLSVQDTEGHQWQVDCDLETHSLIHDVKIK